MDIDVKYLHENVGFKLDELVIIGKKEATKVLKKNACLFQNISLHKIDNSHMLYGFNELGNPIKIGFEGDLISRIIILTTKVNYERFKVCIAYDGSRYAGFQIQKNETTIQGELTKAISFVNNDETLVQGASRTDAGVHATNYVFHFDTDKDLTEDQWLKYLNHQLPKDIYVKTLAEVHPLFHARYDVFKKRYIYKIKLGERDPLRINYEWFIETLNVERLKKIIEELVGEHDFTSFCKGNPGATKRTIFDVDVIQNEHDVELVFVGNGFLRYMIRIIVYALVQIANGNLLLSVTDLINEKSREHTKHLAPAIGLYLDEIMY